MILIILILILILDSYIIIITINTNMHDNDKLKHNAIIVTNYHNNNHIVTNSSYFDRSSSPSYEGLPHLTDMRFCYSVLQSEGPPRHEHSSDTKRGAASAMKPPDKKKRVLANSINEN